MQNATRATARTLVPNGNNVPGRADPQEVTGAQDG